MQRYVQQLVDTFRERANQRAAERDAEEARNPRPDPFAEWEGDPSDVPDGKTLFELDEEANGGAFEEYIARVEAYLEAPEPQRDLSRPLAHHLEIDTAELPPGRDLDDAAASALFRVLNDLLSTYGHYVDDCGLFDCPPQVLYDFIVSVLEAPGAPDPHGCTAHGCRYWAPECPFKEHCACIDCWDRESYVEAGGDPAIPASAFPSQEYLAYNYPDMHDPTHPAYMELQRSRRRNQRKYAWREAQGFDAHDETKLMPPPRVDLLPLQDAVDEWIEDVGVRYFSELTNTAILAEEVGELARLSARRFGDQSFKRPEDEASAKTDWADELVDILFVVTCLANQTGVDLTEAFERGMAKRNGRDAERHKSNPKLGGDTGQDQSEDLPF